MPAGGSWSQGREGGRVSPGKICPLFRPLDSQTEKPEGKARLGGRWGGGRGSLPLHPPKSPTSVAKVGVMMSADLTGAQETTKFQLFWGKDICGLSLLG